MYRMNLITEMNFEHLYLKSFENWEETHRLRKNKPVAFYNTGTHTYTYIWSM